MVYAIEDEPPGLMLVGRGELQATRRQAGTRKVRVYAFRSGHVFGEEGWDQLPDEDQLGVRAPAGAVVALMPWAALRRFLDALPQASADELRQTLDAMYTVAHHSPTLVDRMRRLAGAAALSDSQLIALLEGARVWRLAADEEVAIEASGALGEGRGIWIIIEGEVRIRETGEHLGGLAMHPDVRPVFDSEMVPDELVMRATVGSCLVQVPRLRIETLLSRNTAYRRRILANTFASSPLGRLARDLDKHSAQVVALTLDPRLDVAVDTDRLLKAVAASIERQFGDGTVILRPGLEPIPEDRLALFGGPGKAPRLDYVLLDLQGLDGKVPPPIAATVDTWLRLTDNLSLARGELRGDDLEFADPLARDLPVVVVTPGTDIGHGLTLTNPLRAARLVLQPEAVEGLPFTEDAIDRLARAVTDRLVGVALGGGGALGLAHLPLLRELARVGVPIDIVSGTSFGSVVAAYYCTEGVAGLDRLEKAVCGMRPTLAGFASTAAVNGLLAALPPLRLEQLPIPFVPVATYASDMTPALPTFQSLDFAVSASGAMPFFFNASDPDGTRYLDGAFVANVPTDVLVACGAAMVIGSDPIPNVPLRRPRRERWRRVLPDVLERFVNSAIDSVRGAQALVHHASEDSALDGDVVFRPPKGGLLDTFRFGNAEQIIARSHEALTVEEIPRRALAAWEALRRRHETR